MGPYVEGATPRPIFTEYGRGTLGAKAAFNVHVASENLAGGTVAYTLHIRWPRIST